MGLDRSSRGHVYSCEARLPGGEPQPASLPIPGGTPIAREFARGCHPHRPAGRNGRGGRVESGSCVLSLRLRTPTELPRGYHPRLCGGRIRPGGPSWIDPTTIRPHVATPLVLRRRKVAANWGGWCCSRPNHAVGGVASQTLASARSSTSPAALPRSSGAAGCGGLPGSWPSWPAVPPAPR